MPTALNSPIDGLPKTAAFTISRLKKIGINTLFDLLNYFPIKYKDYSKVLPIRKLRQGNDLGSITIQGKIVDFENIYTRSRLQIQRVKVEDDTGSLILTFFNQPFLRQVFKNGAVFRIAGTVQQTDFGYTLRPEEYEPVESDPLHTGRLIPIYLEKSGLSSKLLRQKMAYVLSLNISEFLPEKLLQDEALIEESLAYNQIHFPKSLEELTRARERLAFDELFILSLSSKLIRAKWQQTQDSLPLEIDEKQQEIKRFIQKLPFKLTDSQEKAVEEILSDLKKPRAMNRLLQGDVGSGKTIVATIAGLGVSLCGYKTIFMAPNEILARQHFESVKKILPQCAILTGSQKSDSKILKEAQMIIGTHALISKDRIFDNVGLVIIDEQHKFGVAQRDKLKQKGRNPHFLSMTATPIPRTVTLTFFGQLDVSTLNNIPGRKLVRTRIVKDDDRTKAYKWIEEKIKKGSQAFVVCPLIEESTVESMSQIKAAKVEYETLKNDIFPSLSLELLHGAMKPQEKETVMRQFSQGKTQILVTTPVVEVGVDIAGADIILIEAAERFGLAQLHQLRGRVGRAGQQAYCLLFTQTNSQQVNERLKVFEQITDGYTLAEYDLKARGAGSVYGLKQHGINELKIAPIGNTRFVNRVSATASIFLDKYQLENFEELKSRLLPLNIDNIASD